MAPRKPVMSLINLSLKAFYTSIKAECERALKHELIPQIYVIEIINRSRSALYDATASNLHCDISNRCLLALDSWYKCSDQSPEAGTIVSRLATLIPNKRIVKLETKECLSKPLAQALVENLSLMPGLQEFDFRIFGHVEASVINEHLSVLSNLTRFEGGDLCNDDTIKIICQNCPELRIIKADENKCISDACIDSLLLCRKLAVVSLDCACVTSSGMARVIQGSESLKDLYFYHPKELIPVLAETCASRTFGIERADLDGYITNNKDLQVLNKCFPSLTHLIGPVVNDDTFNNITFNLKTLDLSIGGDNPNEINSLSNFLSLKGSLLTTLKLDFFHTGFTASKIVDICALCPNLKELNIDLCHEEEVDIFANLEARNPELVKLIQSINPFEKLKNYLTNCAETLIIYAPNVERISFVDGDFSEETFNNCLKLNPLKKLKYLRFSHNIERSAQFLETIIVICEKLESIHFHGKRTTTKETVVNGLQFFVAANNYAVNVTDKLY